MSAAPANLLLCTAGHIDHGKTALLRALVEGAAAGANAARRLDRLPEEKARGITIALGAASLALPSGIQLGALDAPGHETLVRTLAAGACGADLLLLVVAADEGVMPQTAEHAETCALLGIRHAVCALTKCDAADEALAAAAEAEARALLQATPYGVAPFKGAPVVRVSAKSGAGLKALRAALDECARRAAADAAQTRRRNFGPARLWVDRAFEAQGFGAVATGTLRGAPLREGQSVEVWPAVATGLRANRTAGPRKTVRKNRGDALVTAAGNLEARIRGLQSFGQKQNGAQAGARCALNLAGASLAQLRRGALVAEPGALHACNCFDARLHWLDKKALGAQPQPAELLIGTMHFRARAARIGAEFPAGQSGFARIHLDAGFAGLLPGDNFVLRGFARAKTLGGGTVLDVAPPPRRRGGAELARELSALAADSGAPNALRIRAERAGFEGAPRQQLQRETGFPDDEMESALQQLEGGKLIARYGENVFGAGALLEIAKRLLKALHEFHDANAMQPGMPRAALRGALPQNAPRALFELALAQLRAEGRAETAGAKKELVRARDFAPMLSQRAELLCARIRADAMIAGLQPPSPKELCAAHKLEAAELRALLSHLVRDGSLVRAPAPPDGLYFDAGAVEEVREKVRAHFSTNAQLSTAAYKKLLGLSRKYAVPLMALLDEERLTARQGDARVLHPSAAKARGGRR